MKQILIILLSITILVLVIILVTQKTNYESFQNPNTTSFSSSTSLSTPSPSSSTAQIESSIETYTGNILIDGKEVMLNNIANRLNKFYKLNGVEECNNSNVCEETSDCESNQECVDLYNIGESKCYDFEEAENTFELNSDVNSFISINNPFTSNSFNLSFTFMLLNSTNKKYLVSTQSNLWSIYNEQNNLYLEVKNNNDNSNDIIKLNMEPIKCYTLNKISLIIDKQKIKLSVNNNISESFLKLNDCIINSDCDNGTCEGNTNKKCMLNQDTYFIGKKNNVFYNMLIGKISLENSSTENNLNSPSCDFYGESFNNKRVCLETCANNNKCSSQECDEQCSNVPICEFNTMGRHSIDCIQECVKNNDCTSEFCIEKCENCGQNCPWKKKITNDFDSQYFDSDGKPSPVKLELSTISTDGTKAIIKWRKPYQGKAPLKGYLSYLLKTFSKSEGVKINKIMIQNCDDNTNLCEYVLKDLTPNETYTLGIKAYNDIGLSTTSNLVTFKANITNINMDFSIEQEVDENDIGDFNYCNVDSV